MLKRKLAALLAGAMILTSLPMVSFAASDNRVDKVPTMKKDEVLLWESAPNLVIKGKDSDVVGGARIRLTFENAEWKGTTASGEVTSTDLDSIGVGVAAYTKLTKNVVEFTLKNSLPEFKIPLAVKLTGTGEAKVTIDPLDSQVSAGTYVFANVGDGATKTTIADKSDFPDELDLATIVIDELKIGSIEAGSGKKIKLVAPKGFNWAKSATVKFAAGFAGKNPDASVAYDQYKGKDDEEVLIITYTVPAGATERGSILIDGLKLTATEDAELGDVKVKVSGDDITEETITVGTYVEYGVKITVEDKERELFSGRYADKDDGKLLKLTIEEAVVDSWWSQRNTTIKFPKGIKVRDVKVTDASELSASSKVQKNDTLDANHDGKDDDSTDGLSVNKDKNIITLKNIEINDNKKGKVELQIWVSIEPTFEGDIVATVGGPALAEEVEVTLGKALVPVTTAFKTTEVQIGYKEVAVNEFEITETKAGALVVGETLYLKPEYMSFDDDFAIEVEVTEGDLQIGDVDYDNGAIAIDIKRASKEPSTIKITGAGVYLSRALAEGSYDLELSGEAIIENKETLAGVVKEYGYKTSALAFEDFIKVVTPAPHKGEQGGAAITASFTVGSAEYTVGDQVATADAAPYIQDGRTMVPVKYVAYALGIDPSNIKWDQATKTVTILGDRVVQVKIGSKDLVVNGAVLTMDTAAEVKDGRTFLPISWVASALNVPYSWDDATKTVTFN